MHYEAKKNPMSFDDLLASEYPSFSCSFFAKSRAYLVSSSVHKKSSFFHVSRKLFQGSVNI